jgi:hypothetical protein
VIDRKLTSHVYAADIAKDYARACRDLCAEVAEYLRKCQAPPLLRDAANSAADSAKHEAGQAYDAWFDCSPEWAVDAANRTDYCAQQALSYAQRDPAELDAILADIYRQYKVIK